MVLERSQFILASDGLLHLAGSIKCDDISGDRLALGVKLGAFRLQPSYRNFDNIVVWVPQLEREWLIARTHLMRQFDR